MLNYQSNYAKRKGIDLSRIDLTWTDAAREAALEARRSKGVSAEKAKTPEDHKEAILYHTNQMKSAQQAGDSLAAVQHANAVTAHEAAAKPWLEGKVKEENSGFARMKSRVAHSSLPLI